MIKLIDLIVERRSHPKLNPKTSVASQILEFSKQDDLFVSFTAIAKIGINPKSNYDTPLGLYCYPLKTASNYYTKNNKLGIDFPFASEHPYLYVLKKNEGIRELNITTYTKEQGNQDIDKLISVYSHFFEPDALQILKASCSRNTKFSREQIGEFWYFCKKLSEMIAQIKNTKPTIIWNILLYKNLGYDLVIDEGRGVIHGNEKCQAFFTNKRAFSVYRVLDNPYSEEKSVRRKHINYQALTKNIKNLKQYIEYKKDELSYNDITNILHCVQNSPQVVHYLAANIPLTESNIDSLFNRTQDKQGLIDILLNRDIPLTDYNITVLLSNSPDLEKTLEILLNKNIQFDDDIVERLLRAATDKIKMVNILFDKNIQLTSNIVGSMLTIVPDKKYIVHMLLNKDIPLDDITIHNLLSHSPDKKDVAEFLLNVKGVLPNAIFTSDNIEYMLKTVMDKQQVVDYLLSKNIELDMESIIKLIINAPNKQQIGDYITNKDIILSQYCIQSSIYDSDDKESVINMFLKCGMPQDKIFTNDVINHIIITANNKKHSIDWLLSHNIGLDESNIINILRYSVNKQASIEYILNNYEMTKTVIDYLLVESPNQLDTLDALLSKNIQLSPTSINIIYQASNDKIKTLENLLSRNVPLKPDNIYYLLHNFPNSMQISDYIINNVTLNGEIISSIIKYTPNKLKTIETLRNKGIDINKLSTPIDTNIFITAVNKQENLDALLKSGMSINTIFSDENVEELLNNSYNRDDLVEFLLNNNVPLTSNNVSNLIRYSSHSQKPKTVYILLNRDIPLEDPKVVSYIVNHAPNKVKTLDMLLDKNIKISKDQIDDLFAYSTCSETNELIKYFKFNDLPLPTGYIDERLHIYKEYYS